MARPGFHLAVFGPTGSGKTHLMRTMVRDQPRVLAFDPTGSLAIEPSFKDLEAARAHIHETWAAPSLQVGYRPEMEGDLKVALHEFSRFALTVQRAYKDGRDGRPLLVVVDEMQTAYPNSAAPAGLDGFGELIRAGRHSGVQIMGAGQRVSGVSTEYRGNAQGWFIFKPHARRDRDVLAGELDPPSLAVVDSLGQYQHVTWREGRLEGPFKA